MTGAISNNKMVSDGLIVNGAALDAFKLRMQTQCREIELYRLAEMRDAGRTLSLDQAAHEWVSRFAADFDCTYSGNTNSGHTNSGNTNSGNTNSGNTNRTEKVNHERKPDLSYASG